MGPVWMLAINNLGRKTARTFGAKGYKKTVVASYELLIMMVWENSPLSM
jgi:hypothetical protein